MEAPEFQTHGQYFGTTYQTVTLTLNLTDCKSNTPGSQTHGQHFEREIIPNVKPNPDPKPNLNPNPDRDRDPDPGPDPDPDPDPDPNSNRLALGCVTLVSMHVKQSADCGSRVLQIESSWHRAASHVSLVVHASPVLSSHRAQRLSHYIAMPVLSLHSEGPVSRWSGLCEWLEHTMFSISHAPCTPGSVSRPMVQGQP